MPRAASRPRFGAPRAWHDARAVKPPGTTSSARRFGRILLAPGYLPPVVVAEQDVAVLRALPNLDIVIIDPARVLPNERTFLERIGVAVGDTDLTASAASAALAAAG